MSSPFSEDCFNNIVVFIKFIFCLRLNIVLIYSYHVVTSKSQIINSVIFYLQELILVTNIILTKLFI